MGAQELLCALSLCPLKDMQWFRCSYPVQGGETELVALAPLGSCHGMLHSLRLQVERLLVSLHALHLMYRYQTPLHRAGDV